MSETKNDEWEEVGGMTENIWDYAKELEKGAEFIGVYKKTKPNLGKNKSNLHIFEGKEDNLEWGIWGCQILDDRFSSLFPAEEVKVLYLGKEESESGNSYHNFTVYKKKYTEGQKKAYDDKKQEVGTEDVKSDEVPF